MPRGEGPTTILRVRVNDATQKKLQRWAREEGTNLSQVVRDALEHYLADDADHVERVSSKRRRPKKRQDKPLSRHSEGLRIDKLFEE